MLEIKTRILNDFIYINIFLKNKRRLFNKAYFKICKEYKLYCINVDRLSKIT